MIKAINKRLRNKKGFTLVELIVVIAVLGIISAIAIPKLSGIQDKAKANVDAQNEKLLQNAVELYRADNGAYPTLENAKSNILNYIDEIPTPQRDGYNFYYNANEGKIECKNNDPGEGWVKLNE